MGFPSSTVSFCGWVNADTEFEKVIGSYVQYYSLYSSQTPPGAKPVKIERMSDFVYVAFNKPYGVLTAFTDEEGRETLKGYIDIPDIYPAGRLDFESEGLLLLTNDGGLAHRLTDPRFNHPKTYLVQVEGVASPQALAKLAGGVEVKGQKTRKAQVMLVPEPNLPERRKPVTPHGPTSWVRIVLREGKKRQIRHMTAAVGLPTLRIVRIAMGQVTLGTLQPGEWRYLTPEEVDLLRQSLRPDRPIREKTSARPGKRPARNEPARRESPPASTETRKPPAKPANRGGKSGGSRGSARGSQYRSGGPRSSDR